MTIAISATTNDTQDEAKLLASQFQLPFESNWQSKHFSHLILLTPQFVGLYKTSEKRFKPFYIDFLSGKMRFRSQQATLKKELLIKGLGRKLNQPSLIIDATAGLGRDSFMIAATGFQVILLERSPILYLLLQDALKRASHEPWAAPIIDRMQLIFADAKTWLAACPVLPDAIYLDPMFPERKKSAAVKKEMVILQEVLGYDEDADSLLKVALTCPTKRVVIKRPKLAAPLGHCQPDFSLSGKSSRFDIYLTSTEKNK